MDTCFVIQPFDKGQFDKRYIDIIKPTIEKIGLEAYRVDEDIHSNIPINDIEDGIKNSLLCIADITLDNPNVWYELGYAISANKPVIMICSKDRQTKFPFDVQHRTIIEYSTESLQDFEKLKIAIEKRARALLQKKVALSKVSSESIAKIEGLDQHELIAIVAIAQNLDSPQDHVSAYIIKRDIENSGFTKIAAVLGIKSLAKKELIEFEEYPEGGYNNDSIYIGYNLTEKGWNWVLENIDRFEMKKPDIYFDDSEQIPF